MKVTIDATGLSPHKTGTVTYLVEILAQWNVDITIEHEFIVFCTLATRHHFAELKLDGRFRLIMVPVRKFSQMLWQQTLLPVLLRRENVDVHWGPGFVLPLLGSSATVVTIHDMTFDLLPEVHEPIKRVYFPFMIRRAVKRAERILAVSQSTADDLDRLIPGSATKTVVTHLAARTLGIGQKRWSSDATPSNLDIAARPMRERSSYGATQEEIPSKRLQSKPYVLFIGTLEPRKNLDRLLQAWKQLSVDVRGEYRLIVVGAKGWMVDQLPAQVDGSVEFVGHVSDQVLQGYLEGTVCFVYPSLYEGFGLPVIEAMAAGVPVLTSNVGATREIAKDAALLVDPLSVNDIESGLRRMLTDSGYRRRLSEKGSLRARKFSWAKTARLTLEALVEASKSRL
jgi:glycosyltransferase involved in cell wall biosynthesis